MTLENKCRLHWKRLGITNTQTLKTYIQSIFSKHDHQKFVMVDLYKLVLPDWDNIQKIEGYPEAGRELSIFISKQFMQFDRKHHPDCMAGGAWMNAGFSVNGNLGLWQISLRNCRVIMN
jgi:hypothetical protein